ncbi:MAG: ABC transporter transmembrane domain-containing protein, partial [Bacteroidota bacterium]
MKELKRLIPYIRLHKNKLYLGLLFVTISNICSTYTPRIVGKAIDLIRQGNFTTSQITEYIVLLLGLTALSGLFMFFTRKTIIVASRLIEYDLRRDLVDAIEKQSTDYF